MAVAIATVIERSHSDAHCRRMKLEVVAVKVVDWMKAKAEAAVAHLTSLKPVLAVRLLLPGRILLHFHHQRNT